MWQNLSPQQQQFLMQMLMGHGQQFGPPNLMPGGQPMLGPAQQPQIAGNPLMLGGNSAVSPQQQAAMMQYQQLLNGPQGWGASANGQVPVWQLMMGRSPFYGTGGAVP